MSFLNSIVDKVYVINLEKDSEKLNSVTNELNYQHIVFERFDAINGKSIKHDSRFTEFCNNYCGYGIKGCALSHRTIWEESLKNNYEYIAVFEDDIIFNKDFNTNLQLNYYTIPNDFDIIYLGSAFNCGDTSLYNTINEKVQGIHNTRINEKILKVHGCGGSYAYIISRKCIEKILKEKISFHIDTNFVDYIKKYNLKAYAFQPVLIEATTENSNLNSTYPPLLNSLISNIKLTNQNNPITLNWLINETAYQYKNIKICFLMLVVFLISFCIPLKYYYTLYIWLILEFLASFDIKNTFIYGILISIPFFIKTY
jgi:GR25 family glycosyltransferase involved in LPS biosynthesis